MKVKEKKKKKDKTANLENFLEKNYLKLSDPDQHPPSPLPVIPCLECVCVFTPFPLLATPLPVWAALLPYPPQNWVPRAVPDNCQHHRGPVPVALGPGSINLNVAL